MVIGKDSKIDVIHVPHLQRFDHIVPESFELKILALCNNT